MILLYILTLIPMLLICMLFWLTRQFANPTIEEIMFCLTTPISGTDFNTILKFIIMVILPALIYTCAFFLIFKFLKDEKKQKIYRILLLIFGICEIVVACLYAQKKLDIINYVKSQMIQHSSKKIMLKLIIIK